MTSRKFLLLATTALLAGTGCSLVDSNGTVAPQEVELGLFGLPVGEPVDVISATKGDGVSFDKFQVTFNNAEGTDITITTPEGEEINFSEADLEWAGYDPNLGIDVARLTSSRGDRLDVTLGTNYVMRSEDADDADYETDEAGDLVLDEDGNPICIEGTGCAGELMEVPVAAVARLDEADTRQGFESYGVVGMETDVANLPRYQEDQEDAEYLMDAEGNPVLDDDGNMICVAGSGCAGELAAGSGYYEGDFVASVARRGENVSDTVNGGAFVGVNFADNTVAISLEGGYYADDVDDRANAVTGVSTSIGTAVTLVTDNSTSVVNGIGHVHTQVVGAVSGIPATVVTGITQFSNTVSDFPCAAVCLPTSVVDFPLFVSSGTVVGGISQSAAFPVGEISVSFGNVVGSTSTDTGQFVTGISYSTENDNSDYYQVSLFGTGSSTDLDLGFDGSVQYTGMLDGIVQVPSDNAGVTTQTVDVAGTFGGAIYGAGAAAASDPANADEVFGLTSTAGVFQADSGHALDDGGLIPVEDTAGVDITGGYIAGGDSPR